MENSPLSPITSHKLSETMIREKKGREEERRFKHTGENERRGRFGKITSAGDEEKLVKGRQA